MPDDAIDTTRHAGSKRRRSAAGLNDPAASLDFGPLACRRCRARKVKCGGEFPSCVGCAKADVPCIVADPSASRDYTREEFQELYEKSRRLEASLGVECQPPQMTRPQSEQGRSPDRASVDQHQQDEDRFVGQESSLGYFLAHLQATSKQSKQGNKPNRRATQPHTPGSVYHPPHAMPPHDTAVLAVQEYFRDHHVIHPLLESEKVYTTLHEQVITSRQKSSDDSTGLFQLYMAMAIGSVRLYRAGDFKLHPFGFFTAALDIKFPSASSFNTLEDIENLLLIARFGTFYDIGCSVWELGRLCIRIAVELDMYRSVPDPIATRDPADTERRQKIFWMGYLLDRFSSSTLGRPFAINDAVITVNSPNSTSPRNRVFNWTISLGQLASRIRCSALHKQRPRQHSLDNSSVDLGKIISQLRMFHTELQQLRTRAPIFDNPCCLAETSQFFDLSVQEIRLSLLRAAIDRLSSDTVAPPRSLLKACLQAACRIISSFNYLKKTGLVTFTRTYTHLIFVTSLVVLSIVRTLENHNLEQADDPASSVDVDHWFLPLDDGSSNSTREDALEAIGVAGDLMVWFSDSMPDVAVYAQFFEESRAGLREQHSSFHSAESGFSGMRDNSQNMGVSQHGRLANMAAPQQQVFGSQTEPAGLPHNSHAGQFQRQSVFDEAEVIPTDMDISFVPMDLGVGTTQLSHSFDLADAGSWPFSAFQGMEELDANLSGYIWDTIVPWQGSPSVSMEGC